MVGLGESDVVIGLTYSAFRDAYGKSTLSFYDFCFRSAKAYQPIIPPYLPRSLLLRQAKHKFTVSLSLNSLEARVAWYPESHSDTRPTSRQQKYDVACNNLPHSESSMIGLAKSQHRWSCPSQFLWLRGPGDHRPIASIDPHS